MGNSPVATELTIMISFSQATVTCHSSYSSVYAGLIKLLKVPCTVANIHVLASHCFSFIITSSLKKSKFSTLKGKISSTWFKNQSINEDDNSN